MSGSLFPMQGMGAAGGGIGSPGGMPGAGGGGIPPGLLQMLLAAQAQQGGGGAGGPGLAPMPGGPLANAAPQMPPGAIGGRPQMPNPPGMPMQMPQGPAQPPGNPMSALGGAGGLEGLLAALKGSQQGLTPAGAGIGAVPQSLLGPASLPGAAMNPAMMGQIAPAMAAGQGGGIMDLIRRLFPGIGGGAAPS